MFTSVFLSACLRHVVTSVFLSACLRHVVTSVFLSACFTTLVNGESRSGKAITWKECASHERFRLTR